MKSNDGSRQWDDLLKQTFGSEGKPDAAFSASAPPPRKRPFYRKPRFWVILAALLLVIGTAIWLLPKETRPGEAQSPEDANMEEALETCKNALAQWQALENYHIHQSFLYYGDTTAAASEAEFWRNGKDFLLLTSSDSLGMVNGYLYQDGKLYSAYAYGAGTSFSKPWAEWPAETAEIQSMFPWPMGFDWDACEIKGMSNYYVSDGTGGTRLYTAEFAVVRDESVYGEQSPYHVNFTFGKGEELESVTVVYTKPGEGANTSVSAVTFRLGTETESEIEMKVGTALRMPLTSLIPPPIARTDPA